jgi:hypothetical protein
MSLVDLIKKKMAEQKEQKKLVNEIKQELQAEVKEEVKDEIKSELKQKMKDDYKKQVLGSNTSVLQKLGLELKEMGKKASENIDKSGGLGGGGFGKNMPNLGGTGFRFGSNARLGNDVEIIPSEDLSRTSRFVNRENQLGREGQREFIPKDKIVEAFSLKRKEKL